MIATSDVRHTDSSICAAYRPWRVLPNHSLPAMVVPALALFLYGIAVWLHGAVAILVGSRRRIETSKRAQCIHGRVGSAMSLRYLKGGGPGCYYPGPAPFGVRRVLATRSFSGDFFLRCCPRRSRSLTRICCTAMPPYPLDERTRDLRQPRRG